ncbi:hypothetical protein C2845_PM15G26420 [Panicum miliaceum]|uniref:Uncharacterized protein n=1 Tax=Panicum miliaceum TaxID=4540 RepID=A0A3L6Q7S0_PANMI|nr:hypothetical protein C2845_PM15G26420 [Panicum miliaceum]
MEVAAAGLGIWGRASVLGPGLLPGQFGFVPATGDWDSQLILEQYTLSKFGFVTMQYTLSKGGCQENP